MVKRTYKAYLVAFLGICCLLADSNFADARGGRGGGRSSAGRSGGNGGRSSAGRSGGGGNRSTSRQQKPSGANRSSMGHGSGSKTSPRSSSPSGSGRSNSARPSQPHGAANNANRSSAGNRSNFENNRFGAGNFGNANRETTRPGSTNRSFEDGNRLGNPGQRPFAGGRPGEAGNRPQIGGENAGRFANGNVASNRPNWDRSNADHANWGLGNKDWAGDWHANSINDHHGWYNGCNAGHWGSNWYAPAAWGAAGWGLAAVTNPWGYGTAYSNPYYTAPVATTTAPHDYSQPVVVNNYTDPASATALAQSSESEEGLKLFDQGLAQFKAGDYSGALRQFDAALPKLPGDPVAHEVRALSLFAVGDYQSSGEALNSFLSSAPGMDWKTMSSLYGNVDDYQTQLRKLEKHCKVHANDPAANFVLAYHYLTMGHKDEAVTALQSVVKNQPDDYTAKRMLDALAPEQPSTTPRPTRTPAGSEAPLTELVGNWQAQAAGTTIELDVTEDSQFRWKATQSGKPPVELTGRLTAGNDDLVLESPNQGSMNGSVKSLGPDKWQFVLSGAPSSDPGITFARLKN